MKNIIRKYGLHIVVIVVALLIAIAGGYRYAESEYDSRYIEKENFVGTYEIENSAPTYVALISDDGKKTFCIYTAGGKTLAEGTYEATNDNFAVLKDGNKIIGTIVYHDESYSLVDNTENTVVSIRKVSDTPILSESE